MKALVVIFLAAFVSGDDSDTDPKLPSSIQPCHLNDPNRDRCIKESIQKFFPALRQKIPNFDFPIGDPISRDFVTFTFKNDDVGFNFESNLTDVRQYGLSRTKFRNIKSNFRDDAMTIYAEIFIAKAINTGNYSFALTTPSKFLNIKSQGIYKLTLKDYYGKCTVKGKLETVNGEDYMKAYQFDVELEARDMELYFSDKIINDVWQNSIHQYWRIFYKDIFKSTQSQWQPVLLDLLNQFFSEIPFRRLLIRD